MTALARFWIGAALALGLAPGSAAQENQPSSRFKVDLSEEEVGYAAIDPQQAPQSGTRFQDILSRPWYQNVDIRGHTAVNYLDTGNAGFRPIGSFMLREANLFIEAQIAENISALLEVQFSRTGLNDDGNLHSDEAYIHFREVIASHPKLLNVKVGAVDIPFGEEYLRRDAIDNPTINYSAAVPYGKDEGILGYGEYGGLNWYAAVMDGTLSRSNDDNSEKAVALKVSGNPWASLYVSGSVMRTGSTTRAANCFGGSFLAPVGAVPVTSSAGSSPSERISALMYEVNVKLQSSKATYLWGSFGQAHVDDNAPGFDRDLTWFFLEPSIEIAEGWYLAARYSEFGTYHSDEGYMMNGKLSGSGIAAFGWDTNRLQRVGLTLGYHPHKNLWVKAEVGRDRFWVIDQSPLTPGSDRREYFAFEIVVGF